VLQGIEGVDDESVAEEVVEAHVDDEAVHGVGAFLEGFDEVGSVQRQAPREGDRTREVAALAGGGPRELRGVEQRDQRHEARGVEDVARHAELSGDGERRGAEHVGEEGRDSSGGGVVEEGAEQGAEVRERALDDGDDASHDVRAGGEVVEGHLRERGGGDARREGGQARGRGEVGVGDDRGGDAVERGEARGELGHRGDVTHAGAGEHDDVRGRGGHSMRHLSLLRSSVRFAYLVYVAIYSGG